MEDIIKKFKFRDKAVVLNAPATMNDLFINFGSIEKLNKKTLAGNTLIFINNKKELIDFLQNDLQYIEHDSVLWFAYPKGTSKIKTNINRDIIRITAEEYGIITVTAISINETWSALRFRPVDKVGT